MKWFTIFCSRHTVVSRWRILRLTPHPELNQISRGTRKGCDYWERGWMGRSGFSRCIYQHLRGVLVRILAADYFLSRFVTCSFSARASFMGVFSKGNGMRTPAPVTSLSFQKLSSLETIAWNLFSGLSKFVSKRTNLHGLWLIMQSFFFSHVLPNESLVTR